MIMGTITLLRQFKSDYRNEFIGLLGQYVRSAMMTNANQKSASDLPVEPAKIVNFLENFIDYSRLDRKVHFILDLLFIVLISVYKIQIK